MNKIFLFLISISISLGCFSLMSRAEDLLQVYKQAKASNPGLHKTIADRDTEFEKINEAHSFMLPLLELSAGDVDDYRYGSHHKMNSIITHGSLSLTQTVFDMSKLHALTLQEKTANISNIILQISSQGLILETATAYLNALYDMDVLSYIYEQKKSAYRAQDQVTQRFNAGLVSITDVQSARSNYDTILMSEITARNTLDNALERLRQVTGVFYSDLVSLNIARFRPQLPEAMNTLLKKAETHNLSLISARLGQDLAREQIRLAQTGYMPIININASIELMNTKYISSSNIDSFLDSNTRQNKVSLNMNLPLDTRGVIKSQVRQARYGFVVASALLESAHRNLVQNVCTSFNNLHASIRGIDIYKKAVVSAQDFLNIIEFRYKQGISTAVDVSSATTALYNLKQQLSGARYTYLINQLNIKSSLGTLNEKDLMVLNGLLDKPILLSKKNITPVVY
ncbi:outer membrane channel protein [Serratia symbiotica str. 'Cinara cedri']|nr:outer membrane channel protein [Serratia symbiotica str. 'Cinara cedri']